VDQNPERPDLNDAARADVFKTSVVVAHAAQGELPELFFLAKA
jgi:hypothetical protein